jgi:SAM-dependent methyltransferase
MASVCEEVHRVLKPDGRFYVVEPWSTPFLSFVNAVVSIPFVRAMWRKGDALAEMNFRERETFYPWLAAPDAILKILQASFDTERKSIAFGKLKWVGRPRG